jgi:hypothetical protein
MTKYIMSMSMSRYKKIYYRYIILSYQPGHRHDGRVYFLIYCQFPILK